VILFDLARERFMKAVMSIILVLGLSLCVAAQTQGSQGNTQQDNSQMKQNTQGSQTSTSSAQNMSGKVSHDGKTFVSDTDNQSYKIGNPDALQGKEDQHVALVVHVDPDTNVIHIMQVAMPPQ